MRQRFGIAQALLGDPGLIIVDEPTAGLDPAERNRFHALLAELSRDKVILLSTHIVDDVEELCSNVAVLVAGRVKRYGSPASLVANLRGKLWSKRISREDLDATSQDPRFISTRLREGEPVVLTVTEFLILHALAQRPGFVKSRDQLMDAAYDDQVYVDDRTIDSHIKRVRKKFRVVDDSFASIETLYGVGYRYKEV